MEVTTVEVKQYFSNLKKEILDHQAHWEEIDPRLHAVGVLKRANRLGWYESILPKIEDAIAAIEDIEYRDDFIE